MSKVNGCEKVNQYQCTIEWEKCKYYEFKGDGYSRRCTFDNGNMECTNPEAIKEAESGEGE